MVLIIKKVNAPAQEADPLVNPREPVPIALPPEPVQPEPHDPKKSIDWWTKHGLSPNAQPKVCAFCGQSYLKPCDATSAKVCMNYDYAQKKASGAIKPEPLS